MGRVIVPEPNQFPAQADLVVVGAGIVGAATAFFASQAGLKTIVVERREQPGMLATAASSESVREQWMQPHNIQMMRESMDMLERIAEVVGVPGLDIGLRQQGYLFLTAEAEGARQFEHLVERQHHFCLQGVQLLDGNEVRRRFPWVDRTVVAGRFNQRDGWLAVHELLWGFIKGSQATIYVQTAVTGIESGPRGVTAVMTDRGVIRTRRVVIAAGPFAGRVAAMAGVRLPLLNVRRQEVRLAQRDLCPATAPMVIDDDTHAYWRPDGRGTLLGGGETDDVAEEPSERVPADWDFPAAVLEKATHLSPFWADVADTLKSEHIHINAGQYSYVQDRCPVIGETPLRGLFLNAAYDGHGIMGAPAGSRLLVDLIRGHVPAKDNPFALQRFESGHQLEVEGAIL